MKMKKAEKLEKEIRQLRDKIKKLTGGARDEGDREKIQKLGEELEEKEELLGAMLMADEMKKNVKKWVDIVMVISDENKGLIYDIIGKLIMLYTDGAEALVEKMRKFQEVDAKALFDKFTAYKKAGFSEDQAFALVLAGIKSINFTELLNNVTNSVKERKSS
jgi:hypothetical protein